MNASGRLIDPYNLVLEDHDVKIVAQTLSRTCRFWGQTSQFYSVAQHCLAMEALFDDLDLKKVSMVHEWFEGLTGMDIPTPIKHSPAMVMYREAEERCLEQVCGLYGLGYPFASVIKTADKRMMVTEALRFMNTDNFDWTQIAHPYDLDVIGEPMDMKTSEKAFLDRFQELFGSLR